MRIVWKSSPSPRLLNTVAPDPAGNKVDVPTGRFSLKSASLFSGNGRAIFIGIGVGAAILSILGIVYTRHQSEKMQRETGARAPAITTSNTTVAESAGLPAPLLASQIHVSAISLGEPRLALVNGKQVTESDIITVSIPNHAAAVTLRVVKIADGQIELSDGIQLITARLETSRGPSRKP